MRPEDAIRLTHMIDAGERALEFVETRRREDLEKPAAGLRADQGH